MSNPSTPAIRGFQLDASATGDPDTSVNLFRGEVNIPLTLVSLPGPNGLDLEITAFYSGSIGEAPLTDNLRAPTGILGLGWSLAYDHIQFVHAGVASFLEGTFVAHIDGQASQLRLLAWTSRGGDDEQLEFFDPRRPLWRFVYRPGDERFVVSRDDGVTMTFGGASDHPDAIQWAVRWDNFVGSSQSTQGQPQRFGVAWNLARVENQWGNAIRYTYQSESATVVGELECTLASYLETIVDAYGRTLTYKYADKDRVEYQPAHTVDDQAPGAAYQDRYETLYLASLDVAGARAELYTIVFDSEVRDLGDTVAGSTELTSTAKRYLLSVRQVRQGRDALPPTTFTYDLAQASPSRGRLIHVGYPSGGAVTWRYTSQSLGDAPAFNLDQTAKRPSGSAYKSAIPRLWFGPEVVVIAWFSATDSLLQLQIFEYGGHWALDPFEVELSGINPRSVDDIHLAFGVDFIALYSNNQRTTTDRLYIFQKVPYQFGNWTTLEYPGIPANDAAVSESALVAGADFVALHPGGTTGLFRFAYDRLNQTWSPTPGRTPTPISGPHVETKMALAAADKVLAVGFFSGDDDTVKVSDQIYWLDTVASGGPQWRAGIQNPNQSGSFAWSPVYVFTYMRIGAGFCAGTRANGQRAQLHVIRWARNFTSFSETFLDGDPLVNGLAKTSQASSDSLINGGSLYRYDGSTWRSQQFGFSGKSTALSADSVIAANLDGSGFDARLAEFNPLDGATGAWTGSSLSTPNPSASSPAGPQISARYATLGANLYSQDTNARWSAIPGALANTPGVTVACHGPLYVAYETGGAPDRISTEIQLLVNGGTDGAPVQLTNQRIGHPTSAGTVLTGVNAFATYSNEYESFSNVPSFTLHRIFNRQVGGFPDSVVVEELDLDTGVQTLRTRYTYDTSTAVFDLGGKVAQYPEVTAERLDAAGESLGSTSFRYHNGLAPADSDDPLAECYSLASGLLSTRTELTAAGQRVQTTQNQWAGLTFPTRDQGGFVPVSGVKTIVASGQIRSLESLAILVVGESAPISEDGVLSLTSTNTVVAETGAVRERSVEQIGSDGALQTRAVRYTYAWEIPSYAGMKTGSEGHAPMLQSRAQTTTLFDAQPVQSYVATYSNEWGTTSGWGTQNSWRWVEGGSLEEGVPVFDFADPPGDSSWLKVGGALARASTGLVTLTTNALGVPSATLLDRNELRTVATLGNSDGSDANFSSFEPYEVVGVWTGGDVEAGDAHTGSSCVHLDVGAALSSSALTTTAGHPSYVLSAFVKSSAGTRVTLALDAGGEPASRSVDVGAAWTYVFVYAEAGGAGQTLRASFTNEGGGELLVDDVTLAAVDAKPVGWVYDPTIMRPVATVAQNGQTAQAFYDYLLRPLAQAGPDAQMSAYQAQGFAAEGFDLDAGRLNLTLQISALEGGPFDDFRDPDWQLRWSSSDASAWSVDERRLTHSGTSSSTVTMRGSEDSRNVAIHVQVEQGGGVATGSFGVRVGSLEATWNHAASSWQLLDGATLLDSAPALGGGGALTPTDLLFVVSEHGAMLFVDQVETLSHVSASDAQAYEGAISLSCAADAMGFAQVLVFAHPLAQLAYLDGVSQPIQSQQLVDNAIVVQASFDDARGRTTVQTKPAIVEGAVFGYRADFASAPDPDNDYVMSGYVSEFYSGQDGRSDDGGYPYSRTRLELSALDRVLEAGQPGAALAIRSANTHTSRVIYGTNAADPFFATTSIPAQVYQVNVKIDPDGLTSTSVSDQLDSEFATASGSTQQSAREYTSMILDLRDNPSTLRVPNYYAPPAQSQAEDWIDSSSFDVFGQLIAAETINQGTNQYVYDAVGNLRFTLIADGDASATSTDPCPGQTALLYRKYDTLGREVERGVVCVESFDRAQLQVEANEDWPTQGARPRFCFSYDGDGSEANQLGRLIEARTMQDDGSVVRQRYTYDLAGNVIAQTTEVPEQFEATVLYTWNHGGKVVTKVIPSLIGDDPLVLDYGYDARGLLTEISSESRALARYTWNSAGAPVTEVLGDQIVDRAFTYTSPGQPAKIDDNLSSETLYYDTGPGTPRFNGLLSALEFRFGDQSSTTIWTNTWDEFGQLQAVDVSDQSGELPGFRYAYDANGNPTQRDGATMVPVPGKDQLESISDEPSAYAYTPSGMLMSRGEWSFTYDFVTRLQTRADGEDSSVELTYGATVQRLVKVSTSPTRTQTRRYLPGVSGQAVTLRTDASDEDAPRESRYVTGPMGVIAIHTGGQELYVVRDHQRSTRLVVGDPSSEPVASFDYAPFGTLSGTSGTSPELVVFRYTGQEWDALVGTYNYQHRNYDPNALRFTSPDPAEQYASPYAYVGDNSLQLDDPSGEFSLTGFLISSAELVGAGIASITPGLQPLAVPLLGAAIADFGYSLKTDGSSFDLGTFAQVGAGGAIGATEIAAGVALTVVTDGMGGAFGGGALIGAGFSGLTYSAFAGNDFSWKTYGEQQLIGAVGGLVTAGFGSAGGAIAGNVSSTLGKFAVQATANFLGGVTSSATGQALGMLFDGNAQDIFTTKGLFSASNLINDGVSGGLGIAAAGVSLGVKAKLSTRVGGASQANVVLNEADTPVYRMRVVGNIVGTTEEEAYPLLGNGPPKRSGWTLWLPGVVDRVPKVITPLFFNSKKFFPFI